MTEQRLPQPGDSVAGKYRIERMLGAGGMGAVFEATHQVTGKRFALKWLLPDLSSHADAVKRFIREAQVAGRFEHPNVVEVYDVGQDGNSFFMVMELLQGESLADRLRRRGKFTAQDACSVLIPCMRGVNRAHEAQIVHRDLKPDNIFLCARDEEHPEMPKVLDFGISKMANLAGEVSASITKTGVVMGTPHYMAPEQIRGKDMDHRVDVYAFGVILYQLLTGELPFPGDTYSELVLKIATETPKPLRQVCPELPATLERVVTQAMSRDPGQRFQNLEVFARSLEPFAGIAFAASGSRSGLTPSAGRMRLPTPSSGTMRLETPLSTESREVVANMRSSKPPTAVVGIVAFSVLALAALLVFLVIQFAPKLGLGGDDKTADANGGGTPDVGAASPGKPTDPFAADTKPEKVKPETVRIGDVEPEPERKWVPPSDETGAAANDKMPSGASTPTSIDPPPAAFDPPSMASSSSSSTKKKRDKKQHDKTPSAGRQDLPSPPSPGTTPPAASGKPAGRLGISMDKEEF
jgi:serine/threonine-protein kinase